MSETQIGDKAAKCSCDETHGGEDCLLDCPTNEAGEVCSGKGTCGARGKCECNTGFLGVLCDQACPGAESDAEECNGHGKCVAGEDNAPICECENTHKGSGCGAACPVTGGIICGGNGECSYDELSSQSQCKCNEGFMGTGCQFSCPGLHHNELSCSGHGTCSLFPSANTPVAAKCTECLEGFVGEDCSLRCPGLDEKGKACSGNGECQSVDGKASCQCAEGFMGLGCNIACPTSENGAVCAGAGQCLLNGDKAICKCADGNLGPGCEHPCPTNTQDNKVCSGRGLCSMDRDGERALCECNAGSVGETCDAGCPIGANTVTCSGHGQCSLDDNAGGCKCEDGWGKEDCSHPVCTATNAVFNKVTGQCVCPAGNICCDPDAMEAKRAKEMHIRKLRTENKDLSAMLTESQSMLEEAQRRRLR